jgi:ABC-2 type transport system ATP-binding protein
MESECFHPFLPLIARMMTTSSIKIEGLQKIYRSGRRNEPDVHALKPLQLSIAPGEVFGLLGPNGAGKTTLVKLLLGIVYPTSGSATIEGKSIGSTASKKLVGYLPENHRYPPYLTGDGVLSYFGRLSGLDASVLRKRAAELLEMVNMTKARTMKVRKYSKGMMQRLGLAQALLNDPQVVFLDEPTDGVDPLGRMEIREIIMELKGRGKTIFLNSHLLSEVELISDRVAILSKGELVKIGTVQELTANEKFYAIEVAPEQGEALPDALGRFEAREINDNVGTIEVANVAELNAVIDQLRSQGIMIASITRPRRTLEQLFIDIVQQTEGVR